MHYTITVISGSYPNISVKPDKYSLEKSLFILIGIFYLTASRTHRICCVAAHSRWKTMSSRAKRGDLIMYRQRHEIATSLRSSQRRLLRCGPFAVEDHVITSGAW